MLLAASHSRLHAPGVKLCGPATPLAQMALCLVAASLLARPALDRPNIVMLFVDDLGYGDVGFNGHPTTSSPTIDKLAWGGKILTTWYSGCPVCSCSRAALMTGRQWPRYGVSPVFNPVTNTGLPLNETTLAEVLKKVNYATGAVGKWHLGQREAYLPGARGFDSYLGIPYSDDMGEARATPCDGSGMRHPPGTSARSAAAAAMEPYVASNVSRAALTAAERGDPAGDHLPLVLQSKGRTTILEQPLDFSHLASHYASFATDFIEAHQADPFFLYMPFSHVHTTASNQPEKQYAGCPWGGRAFQNTTRRGKFGDALAETDAIVAEVVDKLEALGLSKNTLILFTGDNGPWLVQGASGGSSGLLSGRFSGYWNTGKGSTWEGGIREAGFAHWPGVISPMSRSAEVVSSLDVFPTVAELAGAPLPAAPLDGRSMVPILLNESQSQHDVLFFYAIKADDGTGLYAPIAARHGPFKAHWRTGPGIGGCDNWPSESPAGCPTLEYPDVPLLFNVEVDPSEAYNLTDGKTMPAADSPLRAVVETLNKARAAEIATVHQVHTPPAPDGPGEGPGTYGVCCDRKRACNCST